MHPIIDLFRNLGPVRVTALVGTAFAVIGFFIFLATRVSTGGMALLYSDLDPSDSGAIVKQLESQNVAYQVKAGGAQILVPSEEVLNLRMSLASNGLPGGGSMGYELFDKSSGLGTTNFVQNINWCAHSKVNCRGPSVPSRESTARASIWFCRAVNCLVGIAKSPRRRLSCNCWAAAAWRASRSWRCSIWWPPRCRGFPRKASLF